MNTKLLHESILRITNFSFSRSSGPGGQNVNKVNTKVFATCAINLLEGLSLQEVLLIHRRLSNKIDSNENLFLSVEEERSQFRNREIAIARIETLIIQATYQEKHRIPTRPGKNAKLRRLKNKKTLSALKTNRSRPSEKD